MLERLIQNSLVAKSRFSPSCTGKLNISGKSTRACAHDRVANTSQLPGLLWSRQDRGTHHPGFSGVAHKAFFSGSSVSTPKGPCNPILCGLTIVCRSLCLLFRDVDRFTRQEVSLFRRNRQPVVAPRQSWGVTPPWGSMAARSCDSTFGD